MDYPEESNALPHELPNAIIYTSTAAIYWKNFETSKFLVKGKLNAGADPYASNKFNQAVSDTTPLDREVPDTRERM